MLGSARLVVAAAALAAGVIARPAPVGACGGDFPAHLLAHRTSTLFELQEGVFLTEVTHLVPAPARAYSVAPHDQAAARAGGGAEERALYERGAAAFHAGDRDAAYDAFTALLALPPDARRQRSTWAAYMLGRFRSERPAIAAFAEVRRLVADGYLDELGLAVSSLGEEAYWHLAAGDLVTAVHRYALQAARGHPDGPTSLLFVARHAIRDDAYAPLLADPIGQRLLAIYLYSRADELTAAQRATLWRRLAAVEPLAGADRLAAAAYRQGDWDLAGQLARRDPDATLSRWVVAKLALRAGSCGTADRLLGQVSDGLTAEPIDGIDDEWTTARADQHVFTERAILALADGRYLDAMALAWQARGTYPLESIYIAERVLTIDELRGFVIAHHDAPPLRAYDDSGPALRALFARRLLRAGQFVEALDHFPAELREIAQAYADAVTRGRGDGDPIERARALFLASRLARRHGLDLLGTEHAPDWRIYRASSVSTDEDAGADRWLITADERERAAASAPAYRERFHYRYVASALAEAAADLLPHQSQAFAAALCHATRDIFNDDRDRVDRLYRRYLRDGPAVDFAASFGEACPQPELDRARRFLPRPRPSRWPIGVALALWAIALAFAAVPRYSKR